MRLVIVNQEVYPIIKITVNPLYPTKELITEYFKGVESVIRSSYGIVLIFDLTKTKYMSSGLRGKQASWFKAHQTMLKERVLGLVFINNSALMNIAVRGVMLLKKPPVPFTIVSNIKEAMKWAEEKIPAEV